MCFEVIFPIIVAFFAVFGAFSLFLLIRETWFVSDNISVNLAVDTGEVAGDIAQYLREARRSPLAKGNGVTVLVYREYAKEPLIRYLKRNHIRYYIVENMENKVD